MEKFTYSNGLKKIGVSYIGETTQSAKMRKSFQKGTLTYCIYLAPSTMAYGNKTVCPNDKYCKEFCLNESGRNKVELFTNKQSRINEARIKKTKAFYEDRETFMQCVIHEIEKFKEKALNEGLDFAIRINGTSDLSPTLFKLGNKNILELYPNIPIYDYTKVYNRINLLKKYNNYDLTFSYNGHNWDECKRFLDNGGKVAVVFSSKTMPKTFYGYKCEDGNNDDMRYLNSPKSIIFLHYHPTISDYTFDETLGKHIYKEPDTEFIVKSNNPYIQW